jgi:FtsH-binding integral membrane protein
MVNSCLWEPFMGKNDNMTGGANNNNSKLISLRNKFKKNNKKLYSFSKDSLLQLMFEKKEFLILIFANLIAQLGITYYVMEHMSGKKYNILALFLAQIILIIVIALVPMPTPLKVLVFSLFSYTFGLTLSGLKDEVRPEVIDIAIYGTISIFALMIGAGMSLIAFGINLTSRFGIYLFFALLFLIIAQLIFVLGQGLSVAHKVLSSIGLVLFSFYIIYDTNRILQKDYFGDFITASMDYYLDIINIFVNLISLNDS